jgi:hypothetical protein
VHVLTTTIVTARKITNERSCAPSPRESATRCHDHPGCDRLVLPFAIHLSHHFSFGRILQVGSRVTWWRYSNGRRPPLVGTREGWSQVSRNDEAGTPLHHAALPDSVYCCIIEQRAARINRVNLRIVRCGKASRRKQCKDTAKAGSLYCGKHSETIIAHNTGGKMIYQCRCLTERGTQCPNTAKMDSLWKAFVAATSSDASRRLSRCRGLVIVAYGAWILQGRAEYCTLQLSKAPPGGNILGRCRGEGMASDARTQQRVEHCTAVTTAPVATQVPKRQCRFRSRSLLSAV